LLSTRRFLKKQAGIIAVFRSRFESCVVSKVIMQAAENLLGRLKLPPQPLAKDREAAPALFKSFGFIDTAYTLAYEYDEHSKPIAAILRRQENRRTVKRAAIQLRLLGGRYKDMNLASIAFTLEEAAGLPHPASPFRRQAAALAGRISTALAPILPGKRKPSAGGICFDLTPEAGD
jgi:hypothetical protein